jgi:hypothetical protein
MQRHTMVFIIINSLHVSGGSSAHHQELKTAIASELFQLTHDSGKKQGKARQIPDAVYTVLSSWWWAEEPPETCRAFMIVNTIV